jgi:hypothetical protein
MTQFYVSLAIEQRGVREQVPAAMPSKNLSQMVTNTVDGSYSSLRHFLNDAPWDDPNPVLPLPDGTCTTRSPAGSGVSQAGQWLTGSSSGSLPSPSQVGQPIVALFFNLVRR